MDGASEEPQRDRPQVLSGPILARLAEDHARFLAFVERRVGRREDAEDILQAAFVRGIRREDTIRDGEKATAWFYRLLRNAVVDHLRRRGAAERGVRALAADPSAARAWAESPDAEDESELCACVGGMIEGLAPSYRDVLRLVDLEGAGVDAAAEALGITANNTRVRLHRARRALRRRLELTCGTCAEHACLDCTCRHGEQPS